MNRKNEEKSLSRLFGQNAAWHIDVIKCSMSLGKSEYLIIFLNFKFTHDYVHVSYIWLKFSIVDVQSDEV